MARSFNVNPDGNLNNSDLNLKSENNKLLKGLTPLAGRTEALEACEAETPTPATCIYPRSKVKKIIEDFRKLHKNNLCNPTPYDPCILDDTGLVVPDATPEINIIKDDIFQAQNYEVRLNCADVYAEYSNLSESNVYYTFINNPATEVVIPAGSYRRTLRNATEAQKDQVEFELTNLAKTQAISQLTCGLSNREYTLDCPEKQLSDGTETDVTALIVNTRSSTVIPDDIVVDFNTEDVGVNATDGSIVVVSNNFTNYDESLRSQLFSRAISGLSCTYGNEQYTVVCGEMPVSVNVDNLVQNVDGEMQTMEIGSFVKNLSAFYSQFYVSNTRAWDLTNYGSTANINEKLKELVAELIAQVNSQTVAVLTSSSTCNYGNIGLDITCPTGYNAMVADDINSTIDENIFVVSEPTSNMDLTSTVDSGSHAYNLNFDLTDSNATLIYNSISGQVENRKDSYTSYNCGIYNNTVTVYCDRATAEAASDDAGDAIIFRTTDTVTDETTFFRFYITNHANSLLVAKAVNTNVPTKALKLAMSVSDYLSDTGLTNRQTYYPDGIYLWEHDYPSDQKVGNDPTVTVNNDPWQCYPMGVVNYPTGGTGTNAYALSACSHNADSPLSSKYEFTTTTEGSCEINSVVSKGYPFTNVTDPEALYQPIEVRLADEGMGIASFSILAKSFIELYQNNVDDGTPYSPQELQAMVNERAVEQARSGVSCLYGNILIHEEDCSVKIGSCVPFENNIQPPEIPANTYFADTPTNADRQAVTAHNAMAVCMCADWMGGGGGSSLSITLDGECSSQCENQYCVFIPDNL